MRDNRHWASLVRWRRGYGIFLFDLDQPTLISKRILDTGSRTDWGVGNETAPTLAGTLPDGRLLAIHWSAPANGKVLTAEFLPETEVEYPRKRRIPVPAAATAEPLVPPVLSPAGDRLAWFVAAPRTPLGWPATRRFWSLWKIGSSVQIALWTTRPDGGDPQEVGAYTQEDSEDRPSLLQWTPDGRNLSFRHHGALYSVPAN